MTASSSMKWLCTAKREEMEVLFTLLAERYERAAFCLPATCVFQVGGHLQGPDDHSSGHRRLVHHCVILELNIPSYEWSKPRRTGTRNQRARLADRSSRADVSRKNSRLTGAVEKQLRGKVLRLSTSLGNPQTTRDSHFATATATTNVYYASGKMIVVDRKST